MADLQMNLYEYSKQLVSQMPIMDPILENQNMIAIGNDIACWRYAMLYCKELSDFTIFSNTKICKKASAQALSETLHNRGAVINIEKQEDGAWEIWVRDKDTNKDNCYYVFDYTNGIVEV